MVQTHAARPQSATPLIHCAKPCWFAERLPSGIIWLHPLPGVLVSSNASGALVKQCMTVLYICFLNYLFL